MTEARPPHSPLVPDWDDRLAWIRAAGVLNSTEVLRGDEETALSVVSAFADTRPPKSDLINLWKQRSGGGVTPVLIHVTYGGGDPKVALLGVDEGVEPVYDVDPMLASRLVADALETSSPSGLRAEVRRRLDSLMGAVGSGVRNEGLFASHVLDEQKSGSRWGELCEQSVSVLTNRGEALMTALGYKVEAVEEGTVLRDVGSAEPRAAAVFLSDGESFDNPLTRFHNSNAVMHGVNVARREGLDWLIVMGGPVLRLYAASPDVGVGRKGNTQTFVELDLSLLPQEQAGYLSLFFSPSALADGGDVASLLSLSDRFAAALSARLRDRIYEDVVPTLAIAVANKHAIVNMPREAQRAALDEAYHQAMIILFRLLFVAYAEDRQLLPFETSERYTRNALKTLAKDLLDPAQIFDPNSTTLWDDLVQVWKVVDRGDVGEWGVPAYNGGLFTTDPDKNPSGAATYSLDLTNDHVGPVLRALLVDQTQDGRLGPVDFRSLSVGEFGTIYEGLLQSNLGIATVDLSLDAKEAYVPSEPGRSVAVPAGSVYFHSRSGSRKATGSYFTKPFAVEHLLKTALRPALAEHLTRVKSLIDSGATQDAARALFDFRVTDLSMGSAHFLVTAIDWIEVEFSAFLQENPLPEIALDLATLRDVAAQRLGAAADPRAVDDNMLLRRHIARRCIYGVDVNEIAVELARLAIWIHTFVPGLPLSFLNHGLVHGNSLTGVGTLAEITEALADAETRELKRKKSTSRSYLDDALQDFLDRADEHLALLAQLSDASIDDVRVAATVQASLEGSLAPLAALCDLITAERATRYLGNVSEEYVAYDKYGRNPTTKRRSVPHPDRVLLAANPDLFTADDATALEAALLAHPHLDRAKEIARTVNATHLPVQFPEVFRRDRPGFDCILGNPPWEKTKVETTRWWSLRFPGLRSMEQHEQDARVASLRQERPDLAAEFDEEQRSSDNMRNVIISGPYPGIGRGDLDLYKAFAWRFMHVSRLGGHIGVVVPRSLLSEKGTAMWREYVFDRADWPDVTTLVNTGRWAFDMEPRYTIALMTIRNTGKPSETVSLRGPAASASEFIDATSQDPLVFPAPEYRKWGEGASFRILSSIPAGNVYRQMMTHPLLGADIGDWRARPFAELHSTADKAWMDLTQTGQGTGVPVYKGESFNLWVPDTGIYYGRADLEPLVEELQRRRLKGQTRASSPYAEFTEQQVADISTLPLLNPRIAFRKIARATDTRTIIAALVPPNVALTDGAPYLLMPRGDERAQAYLLGVLSSIPFDWAARNVVEVNVNYPQMNSLPVPRPDLGGDVPRRVIEISGRLAAADGRFKDWASAVGVPVASVKDEAEHADLVSELDALVALLYGLTEEHLTTAFETFHRGWSFQNRLQAVITHYRAWVSRAS